jgi:hypothetical protein
MLFNYSLVRLVLTNSLYAYILIHAFYIVTELLDTIIWGRTGEASSPATVPGAANGNGVEEHKVEGEQLLSDDVPSDGTRAAVISAAQRRKRIRRIVGQTAMRIFLVALTCFIGVIFKNFGLVCTLCSIFIHQPYHGGVRSRMIDCKLLRCVS